MRTRPLILLAALLLALAMTLPLAAQVYNMPQPVDPTSEATPAPPGEIPVVPATQPGEQPPGPASIESEPGSYWRRFFEIPQTPLTGEVRVTCQRFDPFIWHYDFYNYTDRPISSVHMVVPDSLYDSRITSVPPRGWIEERRRGEGQLANKWLLSWFATYPQVVLQPRMHIGAHLRSGAPMLFADDEADIIFGGASQSEENVFPWDEDFLQVLLRPTPTEPPTLPAVHGIRFPRLALNTLDPVNTSVVDLPKAQAEHMVDINMTGREKHNGEAFQFVVRTHRTLIAKLEPGTLLLPNLPEYDDMIVGRVEKVALHPRDVAVFSVRTYSISYGKRVPPPRLYFYHLAYDFAPPSARPFTAAYEKILERADRLQTSLATPLGQDYPGIVTQWALWRQQSILEGHPLEKQALERDLALYYVWIRPINALQIGTRRAYLDPITVKNLTNKIWAQTNQLLYATPASPEQIP
jgi:hypothetical protein